MSSKTKLQQNNVVEGYDAAPADNQISSQWIQEVAARSNFSITGNVSFRASRYWDSKKVGAISIDGHFENHPAILKIQLARLNMSEATAITQFEKQNKSNVIRPPKIYHLTDWDNNLGYEACVYERISSQPLWYLSKPISKSDLDRFYDLYLEYKQKCINTPWVSNPHHFYFKRNYQKMRDIISVHKHLSHLKDSKDKEFVNKAREILTKEVKPQTFTFQHGHFQPEDLHPTGSNQVVLTSNLYWSWRAPLYDLVFSYHWMMLNQEHDPNLTDVKLENLWQTIKQYIYTTAAKLNVKNWEEHLERAFLERAVSALMMDRFLLNQDGQRSNQEQIIISGIRRELTMLLKGF